jgi:acetyltransferase-like isoleucine patch superfamily enzyme
LQTKAIPASKSGYDESLQEREGYLANLLTRLNTWWLSATYPFASKGRGVQFHYASEISRRVTPHISLGNQIKIARHAWLTCGTEGPFHLKITIEDNCRIGPCCTISSKNSIHLERGVVLAPDVLIQDHAHAYSDVNIPIMLQGPTPGGKIRIGEGCQIGRGAAILGGRGEIRIGRNCVVAPEAVILSSFPPDSVISGNPARAVAHSNVTKDCLVRDSAGTT